MIDLRSGTVTHIISAAFAALVLAGCRFAPPPAPPPPPPRVDTVVVTREVPPPLPPGDSVEICLSTGLVTAVHIGTNGDTLIGEGRVRLRDLQPGLVFEGVYANDKAWLKRGEPLTFEKRTYQKVQAELPLKCDALKMIGEYLGVPLFAPLEALSPIELLYLPTRPGMFQPYRTTLPKRR